MANTAVHDEPHAGSALSSTLWIAAAFFAMFSVLVINGRPLFYFDTVGYISQGTAALNKLGVRSESPLEKRNAAAEATGESHIAPPETTEIDADNTVDGSRSAPYALLAGLLARMGILEGLIALNALAVILSVWLPMRVAQRQLGFHVSLAQMVCLPIIVASLGSLPFFVAYLMPDTMAPVLLLSIATLTVFGRSMLWWEVLLAVVLGAFAVVSHLSHLAIAALMVPVSVVAALTLSRDRWWLPPAFVLVILGIGFAEQSMLRTAAKEVAHSEVVIKPYITARMIQDGPGYRYLEKTCPNAHVPTCKLYDALQLSDDPYRLTADHIVFERSARLGSFRLLEPEDQKIVADSQIRFFFAVLRDAPFDTSFAFIKNTLIQSRWVSVEMTLPDDAIVAQNAGVTGLFLGEFEQGRLSRNLDWFGPVTTMQLMLYAVSLVVSAVLLFWPGRVPVRIKALVLVLLLGILVNALVCGGISQPATRFGARVIWLLPLGATILVMFFRRSQQFYSGGAR
ncbi:MAG: hypothetical protein LCH69_05425 [Proteobacteria bacterium]|nr:hypothetical protein [Pseudomonadota bacterium]